MIGPSKLEIHESGMLKLMLVCEDQGIWMSFRSAGGGPALQHALFAV